MGGDEYAAFHYLGHKTPQHNRVVHEAAKPPLTFDELYSPRDGEGGDAAGAPVLIGTKEKSFWRTRDTIKFNFYECRAKKVMIITCLDVSSKKGVAFKTLLIDLAILYSVLEEKKNASDDNNNKNDDDGDEEERIKRPNGILFKSQKFYKEDAKIHKAALEYLEKRLNIGADPIDWPGFDEKVYFADEASKKAAEEVDNENEKENEVECEMSNRTETRSDSAIAPELSADASRTLKPQGSERMAVITMLHDDKETLELSVELINTLQVNISSIDPMLLKLTPTSLNAAAIPALNRAESVSKEEEDKSNELDEDIEVPALSKTKAKPTPENSPVKKSPKNGNTKVTPA